jgi:hypothetical protein
LWRAAADKIFRDFGRSLAASLQDHQDECPKQRMASMIRAYVYYARSQPALHKVMVQEASYPNPRLDWLIETHLKPLFDTTFVMLTDLQKAGVAVQGNPRLLFNMIRLSSGGLLALANELKASSGLDVESDETLDEISDLIVSVFLPGEIRQPA